MNVQRPALFDKPDAAELVLSAHFANQAALKATYTRYAPVKRVACDECVWVLHEARGKGEPPRGAKVTRKVPGFDALRLCTGHADLWKTKDGAK